MALVGSLMRRGYSWNPLRCDGGPLPIPYILLGKLLVIYVAFSRTPGASHSIAPILPWLENLPAADSIRFGLKLGIACAAMLVLFNRWFRPACLFIGGAALLILLWSRLNYSNNQAFVALLLILLGSAEFKNPGWGIRTTVVLLYFGAGLNKALEPEWQSGAFMAHLFGHRFDVPWYALLREVIGVETLSPLLSWSVIAIEFLLAALFLRFRTRTWGVILGCCFHGGMIVATGGALSHLFMFLMPTAYLAFLPWPESGQWRLIAHARVCAVLKFFDVDQSFNGETAPTDSSWIQLIRPGHTPNSGFLSLLLLTMYLPVAWLTVGALYAAWIFL